MIGRYEITIKRYIQREKLLSFGEGMAFIKDKKNAMATETKKQNIS